MNRTRYTNPVFNPKAHAWSTQKVSNDPAVQKPNVHLSMRTTQIGQKSFFPYPTIIYIASQMGSLINKTYIEKSVADPEITYIAI